MATLGTGEHYFVDLVVAFPFALMVQALCTYSLPFSSGPRRAAFLFGTFVTLIWMAVLSFTVSIFWISPILPWTAIVATVAPSILLWNRLMAAEIQPEPVKARAVAATA
jgi:sulfite exporter TauE/SafE